MKQVISTIMLFCFCFSAQAAVILSSFDTGDVITNAIGFDSTTGEIYVHQSFIDTIDVYSPSGNLLRSIAHPGTSSNDSDLNFAREAVNIGGILVPTGTLLVANGDDNPETLTAIDKNTGNVLSSIVLPSVSLVGGSYHKGRGTFYTVDFTGDDLIREIDLATGNQIQVFSPNPSSVPPLSFNINFGDIAELEATGNLFLVSDLQSTIRELTPDGAFVRDIDVSDIIGSGAVGMTGLAIDNSTGDFWISLRTGEVLQVDVGAEGTPLNPVPEPNTLICFLCGLFFLLGRKFRN